MITKAVIPAAGLGTRFLPATKAQPKEMLPIIDTPVIQFVVEEAVRSGIEDVLIISGRGKRAINDHFDRSFELEQFLTERGAHKVLREIRNISELVSLFSVRQKEQRGLGDAILYAQQHVNNEPFAVLLGDTIVESDNDVPVTQRLVHLYTEVRATLVAVEDVPRDKVSRYGIIAGEEVEKGLFRLDRLVEKPSPEKAPTTLAIAGRYILTPRIFDYIKHTSPGKGAEIQLTDALNAMARKEQVFAWRMEGRRYDIGNRLDYLKTTVEFALRRKDLACPFRSFLEEILYSKAQPRKPSRRKPPDKKPSPQRH
ncbi:UTP--glucose-1-phosphate uridylyltransferase GalU [Candidatus Sumerlaeota bacterium]|nr:UTP--glucose-1-phosphate uridylyltransferase GalU [Candidatus Sumerlaeota bacterium]